MISDMKNQWEHCNYKETVYLKGPHGNMWEEDG